MTVDEIHARLADRIGDLVPDFELRMKAEVACEVEALKRERNAVILAHNYMEPALYHTVPDFRGDSLELSRRAAETDREVIVFCGVRFMAETAKILSPDRTVLLPGDRAGCSLAASITAEDVRRLKAQYPGIPVVAYVNTYAEVKAEVDACCTSSNAVDVVRSFDTDTVICVPDEYLARNVAKQTGMRVILADGEVVESSSQPTMVAWPGRCEVHEKFTVEDVEAVRRQVPDVMVLAHPECSPAVVEASDFSGSTSAMIAHVQQAPEGRYLLLTECAMGDNIASANPGREMLRLCSHRCPHMAEITLEQTRDSLREMKQRIEVPTDVIARARGALDRMLLARA